MADDVLNGVSFRLLGAVIVAGLLSACAGEPRTSGTAAGTPKDALDGLKIERLGSLAIGQRGRQNTAIRNALEYVESRQVSVQSIQRVAIQNNKPKIRPLGRLGFTNFTASSMRLWMSLSECEHDLLFNASPTGRITSVSDQGGCLGQTATRQVETGPPPGWGVIMNVEPAPAAAPPDGPKLAAPEVPAAAPASVETSVPDAVVRPRRKPDVGF